MMRLIVWREMLMIVLGLCVVQGEDVDKDNLFTREEINEKVTEVKNFLDKEEWKALKEKLEFIIGPLPKPGLEDRIGIYSLYKQAYHFNIQGTVLWDRGYYWSKYWQEKLINPVRKFQGVWVNLDKWRAICEKMEDENYQQYCKKMDSLMAEYREENSVHEFELNLRKSYMKAVHLMAMAMSIPCEMNVHFDGLGRGYPFNCASMHDAHWPKIGLYDRLNIETNETDANLRVKLAELQTKDQATHGKIMERLGQAPWTILFPSDAAQAKARFNTILTKVIDEHDQDEQSLCHNMRHSNFEVSAEKKEELDGVLNGHLGHFIPEFDFDRSWSTLTHTQLQFVTEVIDGFNTRVKNQYEKFFKVEYFPETDPHRKDFENWDGQWDWKIEGTTELNVMHRTRLAWDLLDQILELVKCHLNQTYDLKTRNEALKNHTSRVDWSKAKLYNKISTTLFRPCTTDNETDFIGTCTAENHEICGPIYYGREQDPESTLQGGLSLLKPKWVCRREKGICKCIRTYVAQFKFCQCGFRTDCGSDIGPDVQIPCQLVVNDMARKQCRGGIAYPCQTHPLAPEEHQSTCVTGYCDMEENSCEKDHYKKFHD